MKFKKVLLYTTSIVLVTSLVSCKSDDEVIVFPIENTDILPNEIDPEFRLSAYSSDENISKEVAAERLAIMDNAHQSFPKIEDYFRDSLVGTYFGYQDSEFGLNIRTTNQQEVPSILDEQLIKSIRDEYGLPIKLHFNSLNNTQSINDLLEREIPVLLNGLSGVQGFGYDPIKDQIVIDVFEPNEEKKEAWLNNQILKEVSGMPIAIVFASAPTVTTSLIGGGDLNRIPVNAYYDFIAACTAGYSATRHGVPGVITAAHCGKTNNELGTKLRYIGRNRTNRYNMTLTGYDNSFTGKYHDLAFFAADDINAPVHPLYFPSETNETAFAYPAPTATIGTFLCHYGRSSGRSCGTVTNISYANPNTISSGKGCSSLDPCGNTFVYLSGSSLNCLKGDSGGPVYGSEPYGIASTCAISTSGNAHLIYSPLRFASFIDAIPEVIQR